MIRLSSERGVALISAILVLLLMSAMLTGFMVMVNADQVAGGINRDQTQAYAAAHAGLEKLTSDLGSLFVGGNFSPDEDDLNDAMAEPPDLGDFRFESPGGGSGYLITQGTVETRPIPSGPYQGLIGLITPYDITVTATSAPPADTPARSTGGAEVRMRRTMQTILIPVFQFGIFSENDLSFFAGPPFNFGGRVHTNQNLFLAQNSGTNVLTLRDRVTAFGEIVRTHLANGQPVSTSGHEGTVRMALNTSCLPPPAAVSPNCRVLAHSPNEGSIVIGNPVTMPPTTPLLTDGEWEMVPTGNNVPVADWGERISVGQYGSFIRNGRAGARRLELPIVDPETGMTAIEIIRRPRPGDETGVGSPFRDRFFRLASLRILLSDTEEDITSLPTVSGPAVNLATLTPGSGGFDASNRPMSERPDSTNYLASVDRPITGWIKIDKQTTGGLWQDVTMEILNLGITGVNIANNATWDTPATNSPTCGYNVPGNSNNPSPNAVIRLQRVVDRPTTSSYRPCGKSGSTWSSTAANYMPLALYDAREGARRENDRAPQPYMGGVMHYVELDVNNLQRWLNGSIPGTGAGTMDETGYVVYFSDRRGNRNRGPDGVANTADDEESGELGFEDFVNRTSSSSTPNGNLEQGEDLNGNGRLDVYGGDPNTDHGIPGPGLHEQWGSPRRARVNPPAFFRRALKLVNGARGQLPFNGAQGLTVASENPVYVQGNFNACADANAACGSGEFEGVAPNGTQNPPHKSAAVIADSVTFLSWQWNDIRSFTSPHDAAGRPAATTWYRLGIIAGKGLNFMRPSPPATNDHQDFGTDGGAHNFIRYLEDWHDDTLNYRGSIVSLYTNRQAVGLYKCCGNVYQPPGRGYNFDEEFLNPNLLPPRTPMFRDMNTLTFRQILRPTQ